MEKKSNEDICTSPPTKYDMEHSIGEGSPTALQGKAMSFIHGVVTVPLKVRIRAGAGTTTRGEALLIHRFVYIDLTVTFSNTATPQETGEVKRDA